MTIDSFPFRNQIFSSFYVLKLLDIFKGLNQDWMIYEFKWFIKKYTVVDNHYHIVYIVKRFKCNFIVFDYIVNPDCTDSSDAPSPDVPVPTLVTRCPSTVPEAYLMQSLWLKVKVSAVDHSRILSDYLSACLLLGGRQIKLTQNLGNITHECYA